MTEHAQMRAMRSVSDVVSNIDFKTLDAVSETSATEAADTGVGLSCTVDNAEAKQTIFVARFRKVEGYGGYLFTAHVNNERVSNVVSVE